MNSKNKINETQVEELDDDQLQDAQGGFKVEINGLKPRQTNPELAGVRANGVKLRSDGVKIRVGNKVRGPAADPGKG